MHNSSPIYYSSLCQILGALLVLSGCSSESPPMASGSPDEFYAALLSKRCELAFACTNLGSEGSVLPQVSGSRAGCEELLAQTGGYGPRGLPTASTTTGLAFNSDKAQACIDAMTCGTVLDNRMPVACREVFDGAIAEHGDCEIDAECHGPNMYCREATPDACGGTCEASSVALGESCSASEECFVSDERSEVVCHFDSDGAACRTPQDVVSMAGETCGRTRVGTTVTVAKCATGLDCVSAIGGTATCGGAFAPNGTCSNDAGCAADLICIGGTCMERAFANAAGDACASDGSAPNCNPLFRLTCGTSGMCEPIGGTGTTGDACTNSEVFSVPCDARHFCDASEHCIPRHPDGAECGGGAQCESGSCNYDSSSGQSTCGPGC
ncbi:MAG: hypothetical protein IPK60_17340 [Sandaracinaceae bacterium]|nr:hypothetical protein [Sandaracinaceae bacterium]